MRQLAYATLAFFCCCLSFSQELPLGGIPISSGGGGATVSMIGTSCTHNNFAASVNVSVPSTLPAGGGVIIWTDTASGSISNLTFTDTGGNTWPTGSTNYDATHTYTGYADILRFYHEYLTSAISASGHITVSLSNGTSEDWVICAFYASAMASTSAFDVAGYVINSYAGTNYTSPSTGTGSATTTNATDLCVGALDGSSSITSATWGSSYTSLFFSNALGGRFNSAGWRATTTTGVQRGSAVLSASDNSNGQIACYVQ